MATLRFEFFRDPATGPVLDAAAARAVAILWAMQAVAADGQSLDIRVSGIAKGGTSVDLTIASTAGSVTGTAAVDPSSGVFVALLSGLPLASTLDSVTITATLATDAIDRVAFPASVDPPLVLPEPARAVVGSASTAFVAGTPDRLVRLRYFQPVYLSASSIKKRYARLALVEGKGSGRMLDVAELDAKVREPLADLERKARGGEIDFATFRKRAVELLVRQSLTDSTPFKLPGEPARKGATARPRVPAALRDVDTAVREMRLDGQDVGVRRYALGGTDLGAPPTVVIGPVIDPGAFGDWGDVFDDWLFKKSPRPVGILFSDRLRFQPAGSVLGEQIYALSLAPNEELQLRQAVETKRRVVLEDVKDREQEQELSLSSTWSTDLSEMVRESSSQQSTTSLGASIGGSLAEAGIPVNIGGNVAFTGTQAHDNAKEVSMRETRQTTTTAASRMRSSHKVRVEITSETASAFSSVRTVRNPNPLRAVTCLFHKIYRKERVTLERYRAQLCLRLEVPDPCAATRAAFLEGVRKIDPNNPDLYSGIVPGEVRAKLTITGTDLSGTPPVGTDEEYDRTYKLETANLDLVSRSKQEGGVSVQSDFVLVETPRVRVESFKWGDEEFSGEASLEEIVGHSPAVFWKTTPPTWTGGPQGVLKVWHRSQRFRRSDDSYRSRKTAQFRIVIETRWAPNSADMSAYTLDRLNQRQQLVREFDPKNVEALRDVAVANFQGSVLAEAIASHLDAGPGVRDVVHLFDMEGAFVETLPFWASDKGRAHYSTLRVAVERLPTILAARDILVDALTASSAVVYLPIREGLEADALALVGRLTDPQRDQLLQAIGEVRDGRLDAIDRSWDGMDDVVAPSEVPATPSGASAWAHPWERPGNRFEVLAQWSELVPTDGVHMEMLLSASTGADEATTDRLARRQA